MACLGIRNGNQTSRHAYYKSASFSPFNDVCLDFKELCQVNTKMWSESFCKDWRYLILKSPLSSVS